MVIPSVRQYIVNYESLVLTPITILMANHPPVNIFVKHIIQIYLLQSAIDLYDRGYDSAFILC